MLKRCLLYCLVLLLVAVEAPIVAAATFKIATLAPDSTIWMKQMRLGAEQVEQQTEGRVKLKFYPGGVMGNDRAVLRKIRIGQLQGGAVTTGTLSDVFPDAQIYSMPMEFRSIDEVMYVRKHMDGDIAAGLEKKGLALLGMSNGGFAYVASTKPIRTIEDLKARRVWLPQGDLLGEAVFKAAGVSPVPLALPDVYTALETGLLDTIIANPSSIIAFQWHTKIKYLTDVPILFLMGTLVVDQRAFAKISPADQKVMHDVMGGVFSKLDELNHQDNVKAREVLVANGIQFVETTAEERDRWRQVALKAIQDMRKEGDYTMAFLEKMRKYIQQYREQNKNNAS